MGLAATDYCLLLTKKDSRRSSCAAIGRWQCDRLFASRRNVTTSFTESCCFYRDRAGAQVETAVDRLLVIGEHLDKRRVADITQEALGVSLRPLDAADVGLLGATDSLNFDAIAAPAGLARLAW